MTSSAVAPLNKEYVEIEEPLWYVLSFYLHDSSISKVFFRSSYIFFSEDSRATLGDLTIYIGSVPTEHLDTFDAKLKASFERLVKEGMDMDRMKMVISREERQVSCRDY